MLTARIVFCRPHQRFYDTIVGNRDHSQNCKNFVVGLLRVVGTNGVFEFNLMGKSCLYWLQHGWGASFDEYLGIVASSRDPHSGF